MLRLRVRVVRVDVARARTLLSSGPLVAQVMWRACGLKDRCYQGVARPTTGLPVLPGLVCLSARGHRPGHTAVRELWSSRVFGVSLTLYSTCGGISARFSVIGAIVSDLKSVHGAAGAQV